jgi:homocitrate synthase NifV
VLKYPGNYEGFDPSEVGLGRHLVIGKHSGRHVLRNRLKELGIALQPFEAESLMAMVRNVAQDNKRPLSDLDLLQIYHAHRDVA